MPGNRPGDVRLFAASATSSRARSRPRPRPGGLHDRRPALLRRDGDLRHEALETARAFLAAGANHVILGVPATMAPDGLAVVADEIAEPLAERAAASSPA